MMSTSGSSVAPSSEPRYTIEQISLLHRLLRTGLTKRDIIHALDSMSKMDSELQAGADNLCTNYSSPSHSQPSPPVTMCGAVPPRGSRNGIQQASAAPGAAPEDEGYDSQSGGLLHGMSQEIMSGAENYNQVSHEEVESLFRRGPVPVKTEIRAFLHKYRLSQVQISTATGISQSYISSFLIHGFMMKRSTQALLYRWYLGKKKMMEELGVSHNYEPLMDHTPPPVRTEMPPAQSYPSTNGDNYLPTFKRRERFTWRDAHVRILETYYSKNPYPNDFEREKITEACNNEQQQSGEVLTENKWVTSSKVYNWFANRRKDANRKRRLGQLTGETDVGCGSQDEPNSQGDHTDYASMSPTSNLHVIEVRRNSPAGIDHQADNDLSANHHDVHVVELNVDNPNYRGDGQNDARQGGGCSRQERDEKMGQVMTDTKVKTYDGGLNTIYTLIEAVQERDMDKDS